MKFFRKKIFTLKYEMTTERRREPEPATEPGAEESRDRGGRRFKGSRGSRCLKKVMILLRNDLSGSLSGHCIAFVARNLELRNENV